MLSMLLLLVVAPQSVIPTAPAPPPSSPATAVLGDSGPACRSEVRRVEDSTVAGRLMWRDGDAPVAHYRLLDRRVNGCPDPIVVSYRIPGSNAVSREIGRTPEPLPRYAPPSVRAD